jgi:hypothetical protein
MNFLGINDYISCNPFTFPDFPLFQLQKKDKKVDYSKEYFSHSIYQFNISQILQWIEYIESQSSKNISKKLYHIDWKEKEKESIIFKELGKGLLLEYFGNTGLPFIKKICDNCSSLKSFYNEYFISVYGLNFLRDTIPTFNFTYSSHRSQNLCSIKQEFTEGEQLGNFLNDCTNEDFLAIIFQILTSLEFSQRHLLFTHYDLNEENILVEKIKKPYKIPIGKKNYIFSKYRIKIIDFGFSTITLNPKTIISNTETHHFYKYGYFPFFTPGTDQFRVLSAILFSVQHLPEKKETLSYLFKHFYKINPEKYIQHIHYFKSQFYNCSVFPFLYKNPLQLLSFLEEKKDDILKILSLTSFPFKISGLVLDAVQLPYQKEFKEIFSIEKINKNFPSNPINYIYLSEGNDIIPIKPPQTVPLFTIEELEKVEKFYEKYSFFLDIFHYSNDDIEKHSFFRTLYSIKEFLFFIYNPYFKFTDKKREKIMEYYNNSKGYL